MGAHDISGHPIHLGLGATATPELGFTGAADWYAEYTDRNARDGIEGRLVSMHRFTESWGMWEMHPQGSEVVLCIMGTMTLHQEAPDGTTAQVTLGPGQYVVNEPGTWHTADVEGEATALFITAGLGTQHRQR